MSAELKQSAELHHEVFSRRGMHQGEPRSLRQGT